VFGIVMVTSAPGATPPINPELLRSIECKQTLEWSTHRVPKPRQPGANEPVYHQPQPSGTDHENR
jgi:hypothetical protein